MRDPNRGTTGSTSYPASRDDAGGSVSGIGLGVGEVARRLGVAPPTLRSWGRRYGLEPSGRSDGGHRRYTAADVVRLQTVLRLVRQGVPTATAAESVRTRTELPELPELPDLPELPAPLRQQLPIRNVADRQRLLRALADRMDVLSVRGIVEAALGAAGVVPVWTELLAPLLAGLDKAANVEVHRMTSEVVAGCLHRYTGHLWSRRPPDPDRRPVLLAGLAGERQTLPLLAVAASLAEHRVLGQMLGTGVPVAALAAAAARREPAAVLIWASEPVAADLAAVGRLLRTHPDCPVVLGGVAWSPPGRLTVRLAASVADVTAVLIERPPATVARRRPSAG